MKKAFLILLFFFVYFILSAQEVGFLQNIYQYLENTRVFELNQEEGHVPLSPFNSVQEALDARRYKSTWSLSLNGTWRFHYADTPEGLQEGFYTSNFNDRNWDTIHVPSNWEMQGYSDPLFRNIATPFKPDPPNVPREYNPTGSYRKDFIIPTSWKDREVFLRLEKTASASFVWINGKEVGYNEGAQEPAEYNITEFIRPGRNMLAVIVFKYSDGYYLEDQDYWRLAGIFDDVWLYATPKMHIFDWFATTDLDDAYLNSRLNVQAEIRNYSDIPCHDYQLRATLYDEERKVVKVLNSGKFSVMPKSSHDLNLSEEIINPLNQSITPRTLTILKIIINLPLRDLGNLLNCIQIMV